MRRLWLVIRVFFRALFDGELASEIQCTLTAYDSGRRTAVEAAPSPAKAPPPAAPKLKRNDAVTLLAALQREARFIDFIREPIGQYDDAQIGAAARDVHRECAAVIDRMFALKPVRDEQEGAAIELPADCDANRYRLTGNVTDRSPIRGRLVHHGWEVSRIELPQWSGSGQAIHVIAPAEIELK
ncbi:MAG: DUF2760 domain-containing protein [Planctomycetaceae bacterium]